MYRFRLGTGAICHLEEKLGLDIMELFQVFQTGRVKVSTIREFVIAGSVDKPNLDMSIAEANDIIDEIGVMPFVDAFTDSILATFNVREDKKKKATAAGTTSSSARRKPRS